MEQFLNKHQNEINGTLSMYDRIIFRGHLTQLFMGDSFKRFLDKHGVLLKGFKTYASNTTEELKAEVKDMAGQAGRPYIYLDRAITKATGGQSKEELAHAIAARDGITEGLICIFSTLEMCRTFSVRANHQTQKLEVVREKRKCLHFYFYYFDTEFGFMHVRLQSWFPFTIQVYINGREWLGGQLQKKGIAAERYDNCFLAIDDLPTAQQLCQRFAHREWHRVLDAFARRVNPKLAMVETAGFGTYYWVTDQCEVAIDVMFKNRQALECILPDLMRAATLDFSCENVMRFLGRKLHGNFTGEVTTHIKKRPEGWCVRHSMAGNSIKMYDKYSVLRIETTLNNSREFKVLKRIGNQWRWMPMGKGVANIWRYYEVATQADQRYLNALANVDIKGEAIQELDDLCRSHTKNGKRYAKFNPVANGDTRIFAAATAGDYLINGFRNRDLCARLYNSPTASAREAKQRCARVSRLRELPQSLQDAIESAVAPTGHNSGMTLNLAFNYSGRTEIVDAVRRLLADRVPGELVDAAMVSRYLYTHGTPDVDLVIRTGLLRTATQDMGVSLGGRARFSLAEMLGVVTLTADRAWAGLFVGATIKVIR